MKSRHPTPLEIDELVALLPRLYAEGVVPIDRWGGGTKAEDGVFKMPWPEYNPLVEQFFRVASKECWCDYEYRPEEAGRVIQNDTVINDASVAQIKAMLTFCVRGEHFCDGHWAAMIEQGHVRRLLERLRELRSVDVRLGAPADGAKGSSWCNNFEGSSE